MRNTTNIFSITVSALLLALFFISGNIIPPIMLIPAVPLTFQTFTVALMGLFLGVKKGLLCLFSLFLLTAAGVPMMSGFRGGLGVFVSPTSGFALGFVFIVVFMGLFRHFFIKSKKNVILSTAIFTLFALVGIFAQYTSGALGLAVQASQSKGFPALFMSSFIFLPFDLLKMYLALLTVLFIRKSKIGGVM